MNYFLRLFSIFILILGVTSAQICPMSLSFLQDASKRVITSATQAVSNHKLLAAAIVLAGTSAYALHSKYVSQYKEIHWDWQNIDETHINGIPLETIFKNHALQLQKDGSKWLWGTGTSAHQVEGNCFNNNWYHFEGQMRNNKVVEPAGIACDHWNRYKEDVQLMKQIGTNTYRFSVEWSKVMPKPGEIDFNALNHYADVCKELVSNGIKPVITLYHYTEPQWFTDLGGFEKSENIHHFVEFCTETFKCLHSDVYLWLTFNSPDGVAAQGWLTGTNPPAKKDMPLMVRVLHNLLEAHVQVYQAFKALPGGEQSRVGILKNIMQLDPWNFYNPLDHIGCKIGHDLIDTSIYNFLTTGVFHVYVPGKVTYTAENKYLKDGGLCLDFVGLNYYCHNYMSNFKPLREPNQEIEIHTNNDKYTIYGQGLYRAIKELSEAIAQPLHIPIYVTENGIGTDNDEHRDLFHRRYLYALAKAIADGYNVHGYILWSLMDNYEWGQFSKHYGVFKVDYENDCKRSLKAGAHYFVNMIKNSSIGLPDETASDVNQTLEKPIQAKL